MNKFRLFSISICLLIFIIFSVNAASQTESSKTGQVTEGALNDSVAVDSDQIKENRALDFVRSFNSGNADDYEQYMQLNRARAVLESASPDQRKGGFQQLSAMFGQFKVNAVSLDESGELRLRVESSTAKEHLDIVFTYLSDEEFRVQGINFEPAGLEVSIDPGWQNLQGLLDEYVVTTGVPAWAVAIIKDGEITEQAAGGHRSMRANEAISAEESKFHWGSVSKSMTATLIAALVEAEKLRLDTTIGEVFTDLPMIDAYRDVTIEQLLAHRSGLPPFENFTAEFVQGILDGAESPVAGRSNWVDQLLTEALPIYPPGTGHRYSNAGFTVAGVMAERVTGKTWEQLLEEYVWQPLGMKQTGAGWPATSEDSEQTRGHFGNDSQDIQLAPTDALASLLVITAPAGNVHSTVGDLAKYAQAHLNSLTGRTIDRQKLKSASLRRLHQPLAEERKRPEPYSGGWGQVKLPNGQTMHWHNGGAGSFYAEVRLIPEEDLAVVIMANAGFAERAIGPLWEALYQRYGECCVEPMTEAG
ncbi:MAG: serine hydrolase domain-containing protein [Pseudomonadota bacterium]